MKIKFFQFECVFEKEDAMIVMPIIFMIVVFFLGFQQMQNLMASTILYYLGFFWGREFWQELKYFYLRCPDCKSYKIFLQGRDTYKSDTSLDFYHCTQCNKTSLLTNGGLIVLTQQEMHNRGKGIGS